MPLWPIEFKSGQTVTRDYLIGLQKWLALAGAFASKPLSGETLVNEHVKIVLRMLAHRPEVVMNRPFAAFGE